MTLKSICLVLGLTLGGAALGILGSWYYLMGEPLLATQEKIKVVTPPEVKDDFDDPLNISFYHELENPVPGLDVFGPPAGTVGGAGLLFLTVFGVLAWRSRQTAASES